MKTFINLDFFLQIHEDIVHVHEDYYFCKEKSYLKEKKLMKTKFQ